MAGLAIGQAHEKLMVHELAEAAPCPPYLSCDAVQAERCTVMHYIRGNDNAAVPPEACQVLYDCRVGQPCYAPDDLLTLLNKVLHSSLAPCRESDIFHYVVFHNE